MVTGRSGGTSFRTDVPSAVAELTPTFDVGKPGNEFGHRIGKRELACVDQHHRRDTGDRLCHRMKCENRIRCHRSIGLDSLDAEAFQIDRLAVLLDQYDRPGNFPVAISLLKNSVMRSSLSATGRGHWPPGLAAAVLVQIANDRAAATNSSGVRCRGAMQYLSSGRLHFVLSRGQSDLPENSTNWRMISMSSTLSPCGQSSPRSHDGLSVGRGNAIFDCKLERERIESSSRNRTRTGLTSSCQAGSTAGEHIGRMR